MQRFLEILATAASALSGFACAPHSTTTSARPPSSPPIPAPTHRETAPANPIAKPTPAPPLFELRLVAGDSDLADRFPFGENGTIPLDAKVVLSACDVLEARPYEEIGERASVTVTLLPRAQKALESFTERNTGRRAAIVIDGEVVSAPAIERGVRTGHVNFDLPTLQAAGALVRRLQAREGCSAEPAVAEPPEGVVARARAAPATAFVDDQVLYIATASGEPIALTRVDDDPTVRSWRVSPDGTLVAFTREARAGFGLAGPGEELWIASISDGTSRRLLVSSVGNDVEHSVTSFSCPEFSVDGGSIYFRTPAWWTSDAIHVVDVKTSEERFVVDGFCPVVIRDGKYRGLLLVGRHRHGMFPGGDYHAYDWCGLVDAHGREVKTIVRDFCPEAARLNAILGIKGPAAAP